MSVARNVALIITGLGLLTSQVSLAKTYKWVDENGVTQYSQTPPPKADFKQIKDPPKPAVDPAEAKRKLQERVDAFGERRGEAAKTKEEQEKTAAEQAKNKEDCEKIKKNLEYFKSHARVKYKEGEKVTLLSEEEKKKRMETMQKDMDRLCK